MPITSEEKKMEQEYLDRVMQVLLSCIENEKQNLENKKSEVIELNKTMMEDVGNDVGSLGKFVDAYAYLTEIGSRAGVMHNTELEYARLNAMKNSPYFARMDFMTSDGTLKVYIGTGSLTDPSSLDFYVFDWRSPIAGMYYDFEPGRAFYNSPLGVVEGEITLKRQFKIWKGELLWAYDTSVAIEDEFLSEALSKSVDSKMQTIVCTIQREQNQIIRDTKSRCLVAFGPAGSGKTSVAMQRAAFFLYAERDSITSSNIMIFSPNNVFSDYISDVLPHLGEANVKSLTFSDYASSLFGERYRFLPSGELADFSVHPFGIRGRSAALKLSDRLYNALLDKINTLKDSDPAFPDMVYGGKVIMSSKEMGRLYTKDFSYLSVQGRMNKLFSRIASFSKEEYKRRLKEAARAFSDEEESEAKEKRVKLRWKIREEYKGFLDFASKALSSDPEVIYLDVLASLDKEVYEYTKESLASGVAQSEDAAPLLYILSATRDIKNEIKYLIVDEAQDYSLLHLAAFKNCFSKANITFLGDTNQAVCPLYRPATPEDILRIFPDSQIKNLKKSYRNTAEISEFCDRILKLENHDYMKRSGEKVTMARLKIKEDYLKALVIESMRLKEKNATSAVIFPTMKECRELYEKYGKAHGLTLVSENDKSFVTGNVIIPAYMAKGLEFDAALIPYNSYEDEALKNILYTACTRALHILRLFCY